MNNKNKIGIITYHNAINYGAILQTYALNKYINDCGKECETINYHSPKIDLVYKLIKIDIKKPRLLFNSIIGFKNNIIKKIKFKRFKSRYIKMSSRKYNTKSIKEVNEVYNEFITGSDQVWNLDLNDDKNYYLSFVDSKINNMNSYAASFGNINMLERYAGFIKQELKKYKVITVREESAKISLKEKLNINSSLVLDPTFLLNKKDWDIVCSKKLRKEKYILLYMLHEKSAYEIAERISKLTNLKVYVIIQSYRKTIKAEYIRNAGPDEFLWLIKNSEYVITDSFHGTALSIIYGKNLKVVLKNENVHLNDRLISILNLFRLNDCIVDSKASNEKLLCCTDYSKSLEIIKTEIEKSKAVLNQIIDI